jgi:hypothetical protein
MIAIATAASAAAIAIIKMVRTHHQVYQYRYLLNATKLMFTLFNISSMAINIVTRLRRVNRPYMQ